MAEKERGRVRGQGYLEGGDHERGRYGEYEDYGEGLPPYRGYEPGGFPEEWLWLRPFALSRTDALPSRQYALWILARRKRAERL